MTQIRTTQVQQKKPLAPIAQGLGFRNSTSTYRQSRITTGRDLLHARETFGKTSPRQ